MHVWMIHCKRNQRPDDEVIEGPFISKEYVFNDSAWNSLNWKRGEAPTEQYHAEMSDWHLCLYKVKVEGSK